MPLTSDEIVLHFPNREKLWHKAAEIEGNPGGLALILDSGLDTSALIKC